MSFFWFCFQKEDNFQLKMPNFDFPLEMIQIPFFEVMFDFYDKYPEHFIYKENIVQMPYMISLLILPNVAEEKVLRALLRGFT